MRGHWWESSTDDGDRMLKDDRIKEKPERSLFAAQDMSNKLDRMPLFQLNPKESR